MRHSSVNVNLLRRENKSQSLQSRHTSVTERKRLKQGPKSRHLGGEFCADRAASAPAQCSRLGSVKVTFFEMETTSGICAQRVTALSICIHGLRVLPNFPGKPQLAFGVQRSLRHTLLLSFTATHAVLLLLVDALYKMPSILNRVNVTARSTLSLNQGKNNEASI